MEHIAMAIDAPHSTAKRYFDLLEQHGYVTQHHAEQCRILDLSNTTRQEIKLVLRQMSQAISSNGC